MNYKTLGNYIRKVDNKNKDLKVLNLQGLSMTKEFRKSTSNIIGTDLSKYKIVQQGQFCCDFMSVIRVHKLPVVLNNLDEDVIISPAYVVFEIIDKNLLLPEYLMLWFKRSEFDRYADFRCDSSIRGGFQWEELCEVELPIPSIEKQREIVAQYHSVENKIKVNEQICEKLEATAQALYKNWFVDFEFPNENGLPYKSSGGKMVLDEELEKEIPTGWKANKVSELCQITSSKRIFEFEYETSGVPFYRAGEIKQKKEGKYIEELIYISIDRFDEISSIYGYPQKGDILLTAIGSALGDSYLVKDEKFYFKDGNVVWFKKFINPFINLYIYQFLNSFLFKETLSEITGGSGQSAISITDLNNIKLVDPEHTIIKEFHILILHIQNYIEFHQKQNQKLTQLQTLLLSRLAVEEEVLV